MWEAIIHVDVQTDTEQNLTIKFLHDMIPFTQMRVFEFFRGDFRLKFCVGIHRLLTIHLCTKFWHTVIYTTKRPNLSISKTGIKKLEKSIKHSVF